MLLCLELANNIVGNMVATVYVISSVFCLMCSGSVVSCVVGMLCSLQQWVCFVVYSASVILCAMGVVFLLIVVQWVCNVV